MTLFEQDLLYIPCLHCFRQYGTRVQCVDIRHRWHSVQTPRIERETNECTSPATNRRGTAITAKITPKAMNSHFRLPGVHSGRNAFKRCWRNSTNELRVFNRVRSLNDSLVGAIFCAKRKQSRILEFPKKDECQKMASEYPFWEKELHTIACILNGVCASLFTIIPR